MLENLKNKTVFDNITIYNEDCCILMKAMKEEGIQVDLTVTSPPYDSVRSYNGAGDAWNFDKFKDVANLLYDITKKGGTVVWVVNDQYIKGGRSLTSFKQALYFQELGFLMNDVIVYEKNSSSFPSSRKSVRYTQIYEFCFILCKGKSLTHNLLADKKNKYAGWTNWGQNSNFLKDGTLVQTEDIKTVPEYSVRTNIWKYTTGFNVNNKGSDGMKHPAVFPYLLAQDHILSWSNEGDLIFDPFSGSGTTASAALNTNRRFIGSEIIKEYFDVSFLNIEEYRKKHLKKNKNDKNN